MSRISLEGNPPIDVALRVSARARRLSLRVSAMDGRVTLTMPALAPRAAGLQFLREREEWLRGHLARIAPVVAVAPGMSLPVEGQMVTVEAGPNRRLICRPDAFVLPQGADATRIEAHLRLVARDRLAAACDRHAATLGTHWRKLTLRDPRSRWGSCTSAGDLMFSWRLIMAPPAVLDYVAAHEVAHRLHMDHSPRFWSVVERVVPDYQRYRQWLRSHGNTLHSYSFDR